MGELEAKTAFKDNNSQKNLEKFQVSCEIAHYGKSAISISQEIFASIDKIFISGGGQSTKQ